MPVEKVAGVIGARVEGVDLRRLDDSITAAVEAALYEHGVLCFRNQRLTEGEQVEPAGHFGEPSICPISKV